MLSQKAVDLISERYADLRDQEDMPSETAKVSIFSSFFK